MSRYYVSARESFALTLQKSAKFLLVLGLPITAGLVLLAKPIVSFFFGIDFIPAAPALQILAAFIPLSFLNAVMGVTLSSSGRQGLRLALYLLITLLRTALMFFLVKALSLNGAAAAIVASEAALFAMNYYMGVRAGQRLRLESILPKPLAASLAMALLVLFLRPLNLFLIVSLSALFYFALLYGIGGIDASDRAVLRDFQLKIDKKWPSFSRGNKN